MRLLKLALISFVVFFGIITAMSLLVPAHIRISRAVNLKKSNHILALISDQQNWERWHPFFQSTNPDSLLRNHNIRIDAVAVSDSTVIMNWLQSSKTPIVNTWQVHALATTDSVALQWFMDFRLQWYPWQKFGSLLYEKTYGTLMEQGLQNIKKLSQEEKVLIP